MLVKDMLMKKGSLNVFTDASKITYEGVVYTASCVSIYYWNDNLVTENTYLLKNSTNNIGELYGVFKGITDAHKYIKSMPEWFNSINLFSDSSFCITGLTSWMHSWIQNRDDFGFLYNSNKQPVANQRIFSAIVSEILSIDESIPVRLFKNRGHVDSPNKLQNARTYFENANDLYFKNQSCDMSLIKYISDKNDHADRQSRYVLNDARERNLLSRTIDINDALPITFSIPDTKTMELYFKRISRPII